MGLKQLEPVKETIGGYTFYIRPFPAMKAANLTGELLSMLVPLFGALVPLIDTKKENGEEDISLDDADVGAAVTAMAKAVSVDGNRLEKMIRTLLIGGHIAVETETEDGETGAEKLDIDLLNEIFCGGVQDLFLLCFAVLKINFSGFFGKFAGRSGKAKEALAEIARKII